MNLNQVEKAMHKAVAELGGIQASIDACERMYCATFRSTECKLSELDEEGQDYASTLKTELAVHLYVSETRSKAPIEPVGDCDQDELESDYMLDSYYASVEAFEGHADSWFANKYPDFVITDETQVVSFCNYKGEGEGGLGLYALHKYLPIFVSKSESFNAVN